MHWRGFPTHVTWPELVVRFPNLIMFPWLEGMICFCSGDAAKWLRCAGEGPRLPWEEQGSGMRWGVTPPTSGAHRRAGAIPYHLGSEQCHEDGQHWEDWGRSFPSATSLACPLQERERRSRCRSCPVWGECGGLCLVCGDPAVRNRSLAPTESGPQLHLFFLPVGWRQLKVRQKLQGGSITQEG